MLLKLNMEHRAALWHVGAREASSVELPGERPVFFQPDRKQLESPHLACGGSRVKPWMVTLLLCVSTLMASAQVAPSGTAPGQPFVVEYYYKAKWGYADEFSRLFKKNHYPLLKKQVEMGRMLKVWMDQTRYHATEDGRWDYRVTIVFRNAAVANESFDEDALKKQIFPDQATYAQEEQRRFAILDAHWDLPIKGVDLEGK